MLLRFSILHHLRLVLCLTLLGSALLRMPTTASAQTRAEPRPEHVVKADYLLNFALLCKWPTERAISPDAPLVIGVLGDDAVATELRQIAENQTNIPFNVRTLSRAGDELGCHLVFIGSSSTPKRAAMLDTLRGQPILTVGESADFLAQGGILAFRRDEGRLRFAARPTSAQVAGLTLSSQLLRLARIEE
jgi:hypothetical protein